MKKTALALLIFLTVCFAAAAPAQQVIKTPNLGLLYFNQGTTPYPGAPDWNTTLGNDFSLIDTAIGNTNNLVPTPAASLLTNGSMASPTLAASLLTNGAMTSNITGWSGASWAWASGYGGCALHTIGATTALSSSNAVVIGTPYLITYTVRQGTPPFVGRSRPLGTTGTVTMSCGGLTDTARSISGTYTFYGIATATTAIAFTPTTGFNGRVQLVSVQAATISGWSGANWTYSYANGGESLHKTGATTALSSSNAVVSGQAYLTTYTVKYGTAGNVTMSAGGLTDSARSSSGTFTYYGTATATTAIEFTPSTDFDGAVQLVSVQALGPALTSCGTAPSVQQGSGRAAGNITTGSSSPTACTVTFATAFNNAPACVVTPATAVTSAISASASAFTVTFSATTTGFSYRCTGLNN